MPRTVAGAARYAATSAVKSRSKISLPLSDTNGSSRPSGSSRWSACLSPPPVPRITSSWMYWIRAPQRRPSPSSRWITSPRWWVLITRSVIAVRDEVRDAVREDRDPAHRQHRLGPLGAELAEPGAEPGAQQHRAHAGTVARRERGRQVARRQDISGLVRCGVRVGAARSCAARRGDRGARGRLRVRSRGRGRRREAVRRRAGRATAAFGAWDGEALVGVAAVGGNRVRVLAVAPGRRAARDRQRAARRVRGRRARPRARPRCARSISRATTSRRGSTSATPRPSRGSSAAAGRAPASRARTC